MLVQAGWKYETILLSIMLSSWSLVIMLADACEDSSLPAPKISSYVYIDLITVKLKLIGFN